MAFHQLVEASRFTLTLTGTYFGGKSTLIFWLLHRLNPAVRGDFAFHDELRWTGDHIRRATDLYNPSVAPWKEHGVFEACTQCWINLSNAARLAAEAYGIPFLSRLEAFGGPDYEEDPRLKGYIREDGEHPTERMGQYTAELLAEDGL